VVPIGGGERPPPSHSDWGEEVGEESPVIAGGVGDTDSNPAPNELKINRKPSTVSGGKSGPSNKPATIPSVPARAECRLALWRAIPRNHLERETGGFRADDAVRLSDVVREFGVDAI
jgi:hypothetical protein